MDYDNALLRFQAQFEACQQEHPNIRLYAVIERQLDAKLTTLLKDKHSDVTQRPLYADTGLDGLAEQGPLLLTCPLPQTTDVRHMLARLWRAAQQDYRTVSWLWSTHDLTPLTEHFPTLLHANLESDGKDAWFFFYQPGYLPVLHRELTKEAHDYLFGSCLAWWCLDRHGSLIELDCSMQPLPKPWPVFPVTLNLIGQIQRQGLPEKIHGWLKRARPDALGTDSMNQQLRQIAPLVEKAQIYGIHDKIDLGVYVFFGLKYDIEYDQHPELQRILNSFRTTKTALIDQYMTFDDKVWQEVKDGPTLRQQQAVIAAYQAQVCSQGYEHLLTMVINETPHAINKLSIEIPGKHYRELGNFRDRGVFARRDMEAGETAIAVPGLQALVCWQDETATTFKCTITVGGKLPISQQDGIAIVHYRTGHELKISMLDANNWWADRSIWE